MKRLFYYTFFFFFVLSFSACTTTQKNTVFQTSTIDALLAGVYDGDTSLTDLLGHGDFGIGTFDHLDGEMIVLDGTVYQVKSDGKVYHPDGSTHTPFATVCNFEADKGIAVASGATYEAVEKMIDSAAPNQNLFYAIKIKGLFKKIKTRSVPGQQKPYPPLKEVTRNQPEFEMEDIAGTIIGFRCPPYVKGINVPGYHLHFISDDRTRGGHILTFEVAEAEGALDLLDKYFLVLPATTAEFAQTDLSKDRSHDLKEVEK